MPDQPMTADQFAEKIKAKYPQYAGVPNAELTQRILAKYPQYRSQVNLTPTAPASPSSAPAPSAGKSGFWDLAKQKVSDWWKQERSYGPSTDPNHSNADAAFFNTLAAIPGWVKDTASDAWAATPWENRERPEQVFDEDLNPGNVFHSLYNQFTEDWKKDPGMAAQKLGGTLVALGLVSKAGDTAGDIAAKTPGELKAKAADISRNAVRDTLAVPENTTRVVEKFGRESEEARTSQRQARERSEKSRAEVEQKNLAQLRSEADARLKALKENRDQQRTFEEKKTTTAKENEATLRQRKNQEATQKKLETASKDLDQRIETAGRKAKKANDDAWDAWRRKVAGAEVPSESIVETIKAQKANMDPEDVAEFRKVLKESKPDASELSGTRDAVAKSQGGTDYENASPKLKQTVDDIIDRLGLEPEEEVESKPVGADRLHVWKTQLEYAVRKATRGNVRYAIGQVLDQVREAEDNLSAEAGASKELSRARALHGRYKDTFENPPGEPQTVASKALSETSPEYAKEQQRAERLQMLGNYDPEIPKLANHIANLRKGISSLKPGELKPYPAAPRARAIPKPGEPTPYEEPETGKPLPSPPNLSEENRAVIQKGLRKFGRVGGWVLRLIAGGFGVKALSHGDFSALGSDLLVGQAAVTLLTHLLRAPRILDVLSKPTAEDMELINSLPPEDAARMKEAIGALVEQERAHGGKEALDPRIAAWLGIEAGQSIPRNRKEALSRVAPSGT